jgi:sarcosine oxidase
MNQKKNHYDIIVAGVGTMGAAACYYAAKAGYRVLGIEQYDQVHEQGSYSGHTRIIRKAYFEHPNYVPLLESAYRGWEQLEEAWGRPIYIPTGLLYMGQPNSALLEGVRQSADTYDIPLITLSETAIPQTFPTFQVPKGMVGLFEPEAGYLLVEEALQAFTGLARKKSATLHYQEQLLKWAKSTRGLEVSTTKGTYTCDALILTAGSYLGGLARDWASWLSPTLQVLTWQVAEKPLQEMDDMPCWLLDDKEMGIFYGFPPVSSGPQGWKVAHHHRGRPVNPAQNDRAITPPDEKPIEWIKDALFKSLNPRTETQKTCLYTYSPDGQFIIDFVGNPEDKVLAAGGFSGHGFKFAPAIGELLIQMVETGRKSKSMEFLSTSRF